MRLNNRTSSFEASLFSDHAIGSSVAVQSDGTIAALWPAGAQATSTGAGSGASIFNPDGSLRTGPLKFNPGGVDVETRDATISSLGDDRFVATWALTVRQNKLEGEDRPVATAGGQIFDSDGKPLTGPLYFAEEQPYIIPIGPVKVVDLGNNRALLAWVTNTDESDSVGQDPSVVARLIDYDGNSIGSPYTIQSENEPGAGISDLDAVALKGGGAVLTWDDNLKDKDDAPDTAAVRAAVLDSNGSIVKNTFLVNDSTGGDQFDPEVAALADGRFSITWNQFDDNENSSTQTKTFNAAGNTVSSESQLSSHDFPSTYPVAAGTADGNYVVAWSEVDASSVTNSDVILKKVTPQGDVIGTKAIPDQEDDEFAADIAAFPDEGFVVGWNESANLATADGYSDFLASVFGNPSGPAANGSSPQARDDNALVIGPGKVVDVLANDSDADGDDLTITFIDNPENGNAEITDDGKVRYSPDTSFSGEDSFIYRVVDYADGTDTASVNVTVASGLELVVTDDNVLMRSGSEKTIDVLDNDAGGTFSALSITNVVDPDNGTVTTTDDDKISYTPDAGFTGQDAFAYTAIDGQGNTDTGGVTITVQNAPPVGGTGPMPPQAGNDGAQATAGQTVNIDVLANDTDPNGDPLTIDSVSTPSNGTTTITANDEIQYAADAGSSGIDSFTYTVSDEEGGTDTATVTVEVTEETTGEPPEEPSDDQPLISENDDFELVQHTSPGVLDAGAGNDTYLVSPNTLSDGEEITISDGQGSNRIQLVPGLEITKPTVAANALKLGLSNGSEITVLGADDFRYEAGADAVAGETATNVDFSTFASENLGIAMPVNGNAEGDSMTIGEPGDRPAKDSIGESDDFELVQHSSPGVLGAGAGDDTYLVSPNTLSGGEEITVSDSQGANRIQLVPGLEIAESEVGANALKIVLGNGGEITVLSADEFRYEAGANAVARETAPNVDFSTFADETLGVQVPSSGTVKGNPVTIGDDSIVMEVGTEASPYEGTDASDVFSLDVVSARGTADNTQHEITGFDPGADSLRFDLADGNEGDYDLADLDGTDGVLVQSNSIEGSTLINFGQDDNGDAISLKLAGVTDASQVDVAVV